MSHKLLGEGTQYSYADLIERVEDGHVLVATWLRDPAMTPNTQTVRDERDFDMIVAKTEAGYYVRLRFFSSLGDTENYFEYPGSKVDSTVFGSIVQDVPVPSTPPVSAEWSEPFDRTLTPEWQEIVSGLHMRRVFPTPTFRLQSPDGSGWGPNLGTVETNDWWEFTPGVQIRRSPTTPGITQFRQKLN